MSIESSEYKGGQRITKYDSSKMQLFDNKYADGQVNNSDYVDLEIPVGTVMGRVTSTLELVPLSTAASDGSEIPVGVSAGNYTIEDGVTKDIRIVTGGEIDESFILLPVGETLDDVIDGRTLRDRLASDTVGLVLRTVDQLGEFDND